VHLQDELPWLGLKRPRVQAAGQLERQCAAAGGAQQVDRLVCELVVNQKLSYGGDDLLLSGKKVQSVGRWRMEGGGQHG
jgi:hypothetical protein